MKATCEILKRIKERIEAGENPETAIPYDLPADISKDDYIEVLFYAVQVLPNGKRKESIQKKLKEVLNVSR